MLVGTGANATVRVWVIVRLILLMWVTAGCRERASLGQQLLQDLHAFLTHLDHTLTWAYFHCGAQENLTGFPLYFSSLFMLQWLSKITNLKCDEIFMVMNQIVTMSTSFEFSKFSIYYRSHTKWMPTTNSCPWTYNSVLLIYFSGLSCCKSQTSWQIRYPTKCDLS